MFACVMIRAARAAPQDYVTKNALVAALTPYRQDDIQGHWSDCNMLMVQALTWNTPQSRHESAPETCKRTGRVIVSWVRLDNRSELCAMLELTDHDTLTDPQIILDCHDKWGSECADKLEGDFSFVIYDPSNHQVFCARDSIGTKPLFYYADTEVFIAASTAAVFPLLNTLSFTPNQRWIVRHLTSLPHEVTESAYENVMRLAPAHSISITRESGVKPREYFQFEDEAQAADIRDPAYVDAYRNAFHNAVETRLRTDFLIGSENSGGLDSVSIMGRAVKHLPHDISDFHCFGLVGLEHEKDLMLEASEHAGVHHQHLAQEMKPLGDLKNYDRAIKTLGYPVEHGQINMHMPALNQSKDFGIRTMLSGYGGDEIVTNQARALDVELLNNRQFKVMLNEMPGGAVTRRLRFLKRAYRSKLKDTYSNSFASILERNLGFSLASREAIEDTEVVADYNAKTAHAALAETLNDRILRDVAFSRCRVGRLEACTVMAQSYGIEYRWPLYDRRLMRCYLQIPAIEKRSKSMGRYLHRRAIANSIPNSIAWQKSKYMGDVIWESFSISLPELLEESDISPQLRQLLDFKKIRKVYDELQQSKKSTRNTVESYLQERSLWAASEVARWLNAVNYK